VRFTVDHAALAPALATVARIAPARAVRPVLSAVLLEVRDGRLTLGATDLETAIVTAVPVTVEQEGRAALPARYLSELMRRIPGGTMVWEADGQGAGVRILWGRSHFQIQAFDADEYPPLPTFPDRPDRAVPQGVLRRAITHSTFAAAREETARALLTGVEFRFAGHALFATATDGFQAAAYATDPQVPRPGEDGVVIPAGVLAEVARLLDDGMDPCDIAQQGNQVLFRVGDTYFAARVLEGKFFPVLDLVPKEFPAKVRMSRAALLGACERVGLVAEREPPHAVTLLAAEGRVTLSASGPGVGSAEESLEASVSGQPPLIAFNVLQLLEGLRHLEGETVQLEISGAKSVARLTDPEDGRLQYMQMPLEMPS
jgi:DNA polymerase-3 subunit beta